MARIASAPVTIALVVVISTGCTNSKADTDGGQPPGSKADGGVSRTDQRFVENAVHSGRLEVDHANFAATKARSDVVKQYALRVVSERSAANQELQAIVQRKGLVPNEWEPQPDRRGSIGARHDATSATKRGGPPTGSPSPTGTTGALGTIDTTGKAMDRARAGVEEPWMSAAEDAFDNGFVAAHIKTLQDAIALFQEEANSGWDPELKAFATKHLPTLREQLTKAQDLRKSLPRGSLQP